MYFRIDTRPTDMSFFPSSGFFWISFLETMITKISYVFKYFATLYSPFFVSV